MAAPTSIGRRWTTQWSSSRIFSVDLQSLLAAASIAALTVVGLLLRLRGLVVPWRNLWIDETFSIWLADLPPLRAVSVIAQIDQHPPLYALLLHLWLLPRDDPWWARLSSVILGTLAIPAAALVGREVGGRRNALVAAALVTFSPILVRYAQEVRMYALVVLFVLLSTFFLLRGIERSGRRDWLGYGVTTLLLAYTHNIALFLLPCQAAFAFLRTRGRPTIWRAYLATMAGVGMLWLPWAPALVHQSAGVVERFWISTPSASYVLETILDFLNAFAPPNGSLLGVTVPLGVLGLGLLVPFVALATLGFVAGWRRSSLLFLVSFLGPIAVDVLLSQWRPIFEERVLVYTTVGALMLVALGITARSPVITVLLLAPVIWLNVVSLNNYDANFQKEQWETTAAFLAQHAQPGDLILFNATWTQLPFDYYYRRIGGPPLVEHGLPVDLFDRRVLEPPMLPSDVPTVARLTAGRQHVWVLLSHDWYNDPQHLIRPAAQALFPRSAEYRFGNIVVIEYRR